MHVCACTCVWVCVCVCVCERQREKEKRKVDPLPTTFAGASISSFPGPRIPVYRGADFVLRAVLVDDRTSKATRRQGGGQKGEHRFFPREASAAQNDERAMHDV